MSESFRASYGLIFVSVEVFGSLGSAVLRLALDTGATRTMINSEHLVVIGCAPDHAAEKVRVTTGSGVEFAPLVTLQRVVALGQERVDLPVLAHTLPPTAGIDGLLGLDFLRGHKLEIDFRQGVLSLS